MEKVTPADFEEAWRINALGLFLTARRVIPAMTAAGRGAIVVVGATASLRGMAGTAAFASAKAAQRSLAQSLARHLWPKGVHVSLIIIDGVVGGPDTRERFPGHARATSSSSPLRSRTSRSLSCGKTVRRGASRWKPVPTARSGDRQERRPGLPVLRHIERRPWVIFFGFASSGIAPKPAIHPSPETRLSNASLQR